MAVRAPRRKKDPPAPAFTYTSTGPESGFVAAARSVNPTNAREIQKLRQRDGAQDLAWSYARVVGEVYDSLDTLANLVSRVRLYPAEFPDPSDQSSLSPTAKPEATKDPTAIATFKRLSPSGDYSHLLQRNAMNFLIPGECWMVGLAADPTKGETERWAIYSSSEITETSGAAAIQDQQGAKIRTLTKRDALKRLWRPDAQWYDKATSHMMSLLSVFETLILLERATRAVAKSRVTQSGIVAIANELFPKPAATDEPADPQNPRNPFLEAFTEALTIALEDEDAAAAASPIVMHGPAAIMKDLPRHIKFERPFDEMLHTMLVYTIQRIGQGLPVPPETITGLGDSSHWSSFAITEDNWHSYAEPLTQSIVSSWNEGYYRPMLEREGVADPWKHGIWYDASHLITHPNKNRDAISMAQAGLLKGASALSTVGFKESDAPDLKERVLDNVLTRGPSSPELQVAMIKWATGGEVDLSEFMPTMPSDLGGGRKPTSSNGLDPSGTHSNGSSMPPADSDSQRTGPRSGRADGQSGTVMASSYPLTLPDQVAGAATFAITTTLSRAGAKVRTALTKHKQAALTASVHRQPNHAVCSILGKTRLAAIDLTPDDLLDDAFKDLRGQLGVWGLTASAIDQVVEQCVRLSREYLFSRDLTRPLDPTALQTIYEACTSEVTV